MRRFLLFLMLLSALPLVNASAFIAPRLQTAVFAGGCFWCMQPGFDAMPGVSGTKVGYTGGKAATATYEQVSSGATGHFEAIEVTYDPAKVKYAALVEHYFENIDPTDTEGQFSDHGSQYKTAIFYADAEQKKVAEAALKVVVKKFAPQPVATVILPAKPFYTAEDYHQKYYEKNSLQYNAYKYGSGRVSGLKKLWGGKAE